MLSHSDVEIQVWLVTSLLHTLYIFSLVLDYLQREEKINWTWTCSSPSSLLVAPLLHLSLGKRTKS